MPFRILGALSLVMAAIAAQPASALSLNYDCQAHITRVETVPPPAAGDADPWQCRAPKEKPSSAIHWLRDSVEYCRLAVDVYDDALQAARRAAATHKPRRWIVIMDADETVLDNSLFERERQTCGGGVSDAEWESWVHADMASAVPGAAQFTQAVHRLGGLVAIVTNRVAADDPITRQALTRNQIWFDYEIGKSGTSDKTERWRDALSELARKFGGRPKAVMWIGDQITDFAVLDSKGHIERAMSQKIEAGGFGSRYFVLPDPMYGNWTANPQN